MRAIDADLLEPDADYDDGEYWAYSLTQIRNAPTIEPERPKGKWIWELDERDPDRSRMLVCSLCGSRRDEVGEYNFCHICGAKMINPMGEKIRKDVDTISRSEEGEVGMEK